MFSYLVSSIPLQILIIGGDARLDINYGYEFPGEIVS